MPKKYTPAQIQKELEEFKELEKELKKRMDLLQQELKHPSDTTDSIYNVSKDTLNVAFDVYKTKIKRGKMDKSYRDFKRSVKYYATTPVRMIVHDKAVDRQDFFLARMRELGEEDKALNILNSLNQDEVDDFFQSDYFFINRKKDSIAYVEFNNDNGVSVELARLMDYAYSCGHTEINRVFGDKEVMRKGMKKN